MTQTLIHFLNLIINHEYGFQLEIINFYRNPYWIYSDPCYFKDFSRVHVQMTNKKDKNDVAILREKTRLYPLSCYKVLLQHPLVIYVSLF